MKTSAIITAYRLGRLSQSEAINKLCAQGYTPNDAAFLLTQHGRPNWALTFALAVLVMAAWLWLYFGPLNY